MNRVAALLALDAIEDLASLEQSVLLPTPPHCGGPDAIRKNQLGP
jgi:hypothetical protein